MWCEKVVLSPEMCPIKMTLVNDLPWKTTARPYFGRTSVMISLLLVIVS